MNRVKEESISTIPCVPGVDKPYIATLREARPSVSVSVRMISPADVGVRLSGTVSESLHIYCGGIRPYLRPLHAPPRPHYPHSVRGYAAPEPNLRTELLTLYQSTVRGRRGTGLSPLPLGSSQEYSFHQLRAAVTTTVVDPLQRDTRSLWLHISGAFLLRAYRWSVSVER